MGIWLKKKEVYLAEGGGADGVVEIVRDLDRMVFEHTEDGAER